MSASGVVLIIAGAWLLSQVLAGDALGRLGITGAATNPGKDTSGEPKTVAPGLPGGGTGVLVPGLT